MIRTLAIILLALSTAGSGFFGWKQWTAGQNAGQQIAELTGKVEEASKAQEAAQEELSTAQSQIDPLKSKLQELDAVKAAFSTGVVLKDLEAAYAKEKKLSAERQLGLAGVRLLTKGTKDPGTVEAFQKALEMTDWKGQQKVICAAQNALAAAGEKVKVMSECAGETAAPKSEPTGAAPGKKDAKEAAASSQSKEAPSKSDKKGAKKEDHAAADIHAAHWDY